MVRWGGPHAALRLMGLRIADSGTRRDGRKSCDVRYGREGRGQVRRAGV